MSQPVFSDFILPLLASVCLSGRERTLSPCEWSIPEAAAAQQDAGNRLHGNSNSSSNSQVNTLLPDTKAETCRLTTWQNHLHLQSAEKYRVSVLLKKYSCIFGNKLVIDSSMCSLTDV